MADNTEETKEAEGASPSEEPGMNGDQSFAYWLTMLPFMAFAGMFIFQFSKSPDTKLLINAAGAIIGGILVASIVNVLTQGNSDKASDEGTSDAPKAEGSS